MELWKYIIFLFGIIILFPSHIIIQIFSLSTWSESHDKDEDLRSYARNGIERQAMEPDFEAVHNIDEYATETVSTMRDALKVFVI